MTPPLANFEAKVELQVQTEINHLELLRSWSLPTPWDITVIKPRLYFYAAGQDNPIKVPFTENPEAVLREIESAGYFNPKTTPKIIFITHGFENDITTPWLPDMKDEILKVEPSSLIALLGWGGGANINVLKYSQAAANTQSVANWFQDYLKAFRNVSKDAYIHGIGHSLGAHLLGLAGRQSRVFDRISGLDPAGPSFEKVNQENRLCKNDAKVVDVIHTDGFDTMTDPADWFAPVNHYGTLIPLGTTDFYPNFGYKQPGISHFKIAESHHRAIDLFAWSIGNPGRCVTNACLDGTPAFECPVDKVKYCTEVVEMGYYFDAKDSNEVTSGLFYMKTNCEEPWVDETPKDCGGYWPFNSGCSIS